MKESEAYLIAITSLIDDNYVSREKKVDALKMLFRALDFAKKREQEDNE